MREKMLKLLQVHLKSQHDVTFYPYQLEFAGEIFDALLQNFILTSNATPASVRALKTVEIPVQFARQSGKTTCVVYVIEFVMIFFTEAFGRQIHIGLTAPQDRQTKIDFDRLKNALRKTQGELVVSDMDDTKTAKEESNAHNIVLPSGTSCSVFSMNAISKIEGQSFDLIIVEEAQDANDQIMLVSVFPMGANTNAPHIMIGTAGTRICYFRKLLQKGGALIYPWRDVAEQRRKTYEQDGDALHLVYEQYVRGQMELLGEDADEFRRPYNLEWIIGTGQFTTEDQLLALVEDRKQTFHFQKGECFCGIDTAKSVDSTIITITRLNAATGKRDLLNWLELRGDNYQDQFDIIMGFNSRTGQMTGQGFIDNYNVVAMAIDSTGQGDFFPDLTASHTEFQDENSGLYRVKFSLDSKDKMYKNLLASIKSQTVTLPSLDSKMGQKFKQQMLDLEKEYKGQFLSVHHPTSAAGGVKTEDLHDDYCFSAGTKILTSEGQINIESVKPGMYVMTRQGYKRVLNAGMTGCKEVVTRFGITATANHNFITSRGAKAFSKLDKNDKIYLWNEKQSSIMAGNIIDIQATPRDHLGSIIAEETKRGKLPFYIDRFGLMLMVQYLKDTLFIIKMRIRSITIYPTLNLKPAQNINLITPSPQVGLSRLNKILRSPVRQQLSGIKAPLQKTSIESMPIGVSTEIRKKWYVWSAAQALLLSARRALNTVVRNVNQFPAIKSIGKSTSQSYGKWFATIAERSSLLSFQRLDFVNVSAKTPTVERKKIPVYNLNVEDAHEYFANNVLVKNCDSWALAEWAYAKWYGDSEPQLMTVSTSKKEIEVEERIDAMIKDEKGNVTDYFPGLEDGW